MLNLFPSLMFDVQNKLAPVHVQDLFKHVSDIHSYNTRSAASNKFYAMPSRLDLLNCFSRLRVRLRNALPETIRKLKNKKVFTNQIHDEMLINISRTEHLYLSMSAIIDIIKNL